MTKNEDVAVAVLALIAGTAVGYGVARLAAAPAVGLPASGPMAGFLRGIREGAAGSAVSPEEVLSNFLRMAISRALRGPQ